MLDGLRKLTCGHPRCTPADKHGYAICLDCGGVVVARMTRHIFDKAMAAMRRG